MVRLSSRKFWQHCRGQSRGTEWSWGERLGLPQQFLRVTVLTSHYGLLSVPTHLALSLYGLAEFTEVNGSALLRGEPKQRKML